MAKSLIITEKPSVARDIVAALGGFEARAGNAYWESEHYLCSFAVGHILEYLTPEDLSPTYRSWNIRHLPIIPAEFRRKPLASHGPRLNLLGRLMSRADVSCLINACDAAREGELIFREIVAYHECRKWVRRLWLQSMTPEAIREGFAKLRDGTDLDGLGAAAECRARADWLIGMNGTRAFSELLRSPGERLPWSVGRVQTPTLALLVERELTILSHRPRPYWHLDAVFDAGSHTYTGRWFDPKVKSGGDASEVHDDRIFARATAENLVAELQAAPPPALASETRDRSQRPAPWLFSLTALQRSMAQRYKWSAKRTLDAAQRCYETHKVLTYPRTSSSCLPENYRGEVARLLSVFAEHPEYGEWARGLRANGLCNESRVFNDAGVSDHFAIIPTGKQRSLSGDDQALYDAVVRRFLAAFYPPAVYDRVRRLTMLGGHSFRTGPLETRVELGWMAVYERRRGGDAEGTGTAAPRRDPRPEAGAKLPVLGGGGAGDKAVKNIAVGFKEAILNEEKTKAPPRINEAGLLSLMEHAGRQVEDEELAKALMSAEGLGTAATRADIIQNLKLKDYVDQSLRPTLKGIQLIASLGRLDVRRLTSPELTAQLEMQLAEVEGETRSAKAFMDEVARYITDVVAAVRGCDLQRIYATLEAVGNCPRCRAQDQQAQIYEGPWGYACEAQGPRGVGIPATGCGWTLPKEVHGRFIDRLTATELLTAGETAELRGFRGASGAEVSGRLRLKAAAVELDLAGVTAPLNVELVPASTQRAGDGGNSWSGSGRRPSERKGGRRAGAPDRAAQSAKGGAHGGPAAERRSVGACPLHAEPAGACAVLETAGAYVCQKRLQAFAAGNRQPQGVMIPKVLCGRPFSEAELQQLLGHGRTGELQGFRSKAGRAFAAVLTLDSSGRVVFDFAPRPGASGRHGETQETNAARQNKGPWTAREPRQERQADHKGREHRYPRRRVSAMSAPEVVSKPELPSPLLPEDWDLET